MRLLAVGDIHGCATALETLLAALDLRTGDKLVGLGDYINKGPETKKTLNILTQLFERGFLIPLLGNHELKLLSALQNGNAQLGSDRLVDPATLASYADATGNLSLDGIPTAHQHFLQHHCRRGLETDRHIFVHATLDADKPLIEQSSQALFWDKLQDPQPHYSGKIMICGHTPQRNGLPLNLGHAICLDTAACEGQWLSCMDVDSGQVWQTNQNGEMRQFNIQDFSQPLTSQRNREVLACC